MAVSIPDYFYDIVLLGRPGIGRTTLAKKLPFENAQVRVINIPGFSGCIAPGSIPTVIGKAQDDYQHKVSRVVYFLPSRGSPEKADGVLKKELKLLSHHFGKELFDYVIVAATNPNTEKYQKSGFDQEDFKQTESVFHEALKSSVCKDMACPPVMYIGLNDDPKEIMNNIKMASVKQGTISFSINNAPPLSTPNKNEHVLVAPEELPAPEERLTLAKEEPPMPAPEGPPIAPQKTTQATAESQAPQRGTFFGALTCIFCVNCYES